MASELYIGLMSGTSLDGIDAGLVDFSDSKIQLISFHYQPFSAELRQTIHQLSQANQAIFLKDYGHIDSHLGHLFAEASLSLLEKSNLNPSDIQAIGSHGQTVYHAPESINGFSLQIGDPNRIAELTGITTIADFRRRDIAVGGQGAPLVPAFHQAVFGDKNQAKTIVNIGGIANISILDGDSVLGFDTGPGNTLLDFWCQQHCHQAYDKNGDWGASGKPNLQLLTAFKQDEYFQLPPPKSTGKEYFSAAWLQQKLSTFANINPADVQATLCQLSADSIAEAINQYAPNTQQTLVCGGGAHNQQLLKLLAEKLNSPLNSTADCGINPDHVEAIAFAWLARQTINNLPGNLPMATGARSPVILGGIYLGKTAN
jgi:anhydro-N-acetylmuramic acid kinase